VDDELSKYYELLGVAPGASGRVLKDAYRDLAKVWHPDRFSHDPRLQQKAQDKLKEINEAYELLTSAKAGRRARPSSAPHSATAKPDAPPAAAARRKRSRLVLPVAIAFCAAFFAVLGALAPQVARPAREQTRAAEQEEEEARVADERRQPEGETRPAAASSPRGAERAARRPVAEASAAVAQGSEPGATPLRPMPTVTVTIDAATGLLATRDCPTISRMTYAVGAEPREHCAARHKTQAAARPEQGRQKDSRIKSIGKGLAAPFKWLGGERGAAAVGAGSAQTAAGGGSQNR
jgi:hypothetical protein